MTALLTIAALRLSAQDYTLTGKDWSHVANPMGAPFEICTTNSPSGAEAAIKRAGATWDYGRFSFTFKVTACSSDGTFPMKNSVNQIDFGGLANPAALGRAVPFADGRKTTECDIRMNSKLLWHTGKSAAGSNMFDLESAVLHELGHCLGLGDMMENPFNPDIVMSRITKGETRRALDVGDKEGRAKIYGK